MSDEKTIIKEGATADVFDVELSCGDAAKWSVKYLVSAGEIGACKKDYDVIYKDSEGDYYIYERVKNE